MSSMDRHLKILIELFSEQMDKMLTIVGDVRQSLLSTSTASSAPTSAGTTTSTTTTTTTSTTPVPSNISAPVKTTGSKLDALYAKMAPLLEVSQKMDQVSIYIYFFFFFFPFFGWFLWFLVLIHLGLLQGVGRSGGYQELGR